MGEASLARWGQNLQVYCANVSVNFSHVFCAVKSVKKRRTKITLFSYMPDYQEVIGAVWGSGLVTGIPSVRTRFDARSLTKVLSILRYGLSLCQQKAVSACGH